jgi:hypothetical protein
MDFTNILKYLAAIDFTKRTGFVMKEVVSAACQGKKRYCVPLSISDENEQNDYLEGLEKLGLQCSLVTGEDGKTILTVWW